MIQKFIKIEQGMLLLVKRGFWTSGHKTDGGFKCKRFIPKGDVLEIRYPYEWHFRTSNDTYDHATTNKLSANCDFFGYVKSEINFQNKHSLRQILDDGLYHCASDYKLSLK